MVIDFEGRKLTITKSYTGEINISSGNIDADTVFTYETDTEVYASCAATLHGEFWVIGGANKKRQVSI